MARSSSSSRTAFCTRYLASLRSVSSRHRVPFCSSSHSSVSPWTTKRRLGNLNWWSPFVGGQRHPPALAEYMDAGEPEVYTKLTTKDEVLKDANIAGKK